VEFPEQSIKTQFYLLEMLV